MLPNRNISYHQHCQGSSLYRKKLAVYPVASSVPECTYNFSALNKQADQVCFRDNSTMQLKLLENVRLGKTILEFDPKRKHRIGSKRERVKTNEYSNSIRQRYSSGLTDILNIYERNQTHEHFTEANHREYNHFSSQQTERQHLRSTMRFNSSRVSNQNSDDDPKQNQFRLSIFSNQAHKEERNNAKTECQMTNEGKGTLQDIYGIVSRKSARTRDTRKIGVIKKQNKVLKEAETVKKFTQEFKKGNILSKKTHPNHKAISSLEWNYEELQQRIGLVKTNKRIPSCQSLTEPLDKITNINRQLDLGLKLIDDSFEFENAQESSQYDAWVLSPNTPVKASFNNRRNEIDQMTITDQVVLEESAVSPDCQRLREQLEQALKYENFQFKPRNGSSIVIGAENHENLLKIPVLLIPSTGSSTFCSEPVTERYSQKQINIHHLGTELTLLNEVGLLSVRYSYKMVSNQKMAYQFNDKNQSLQNMDHPHIMKIYATSLSESLLMSASGCVEKSFIINIYKQPILHTGLYDIIFSFQDIIADYDNFELGRTELQKIQLIDANFYQLVKQLIWVTSWLGRLNPSIKLRLQHIFVCGSSPLSLTIKVDLSSTIISQLCEGVYQSQNMIKQNLETIVTIINVFLVQSSRRSLQTETILWLKQNIKELIEMFQENETDQIIWSKMETLMMFQPVSSNVCSLQNQLITLLL